MSRRVIFNADDFGLTDGVSAGILACMAHGVVATTTAMACIEGAEARVRAALPRLAGRVGVHLQLTGGRPCLPPERIPSLVGPDGLFPPRVNGLASLDPDDVAREWRAQVERLAAWGVRPTHLDSHHHVHRLARAAPVFIDLARALRLPARSGDATAARQLRAAGVACPDELLMLSDLRPPTVKALVGRLRLAFRLAGGQGTVEVGCHPGFDDAALAAVSRYTEVRAQEMVLLQSPELAEALAAEGMALASFRDLGVAHEAFA